MNPTQTTIDKIIPSDLSTADNVIEWFWGYGIKRVGKYELSPSAWLDNLYQVKAASASLTRAQSNTKAQLALWGPSQTGKSTFLSKYIDESADNGGKGSALDFGGTPALFAGDPKKATVPILNPWNQGMDGSGCITYFRMRKAGEVDSDRPVKIILATQKQIMHALAAGFCSECSKHRFDGTQIRHWNKQDIYKEVEKFENSESEKLCKNAYGLLHQMVEVLALLCRSDLSRYNNIHFDDDYPDIRQKILGSNGLNSSVENVKKFASELLWDSIDVFTQAYEDLVDYRDNLLGVTQIKDPMFTCSYSVAALLLDIESYNILAKNKNNSNDKVRSLVYSMNLLLTEEGFSLEEGEEFSFIQSDQDFALLQGVVWGLELSLREDIVASSSNKLHDLLQVADILDFPGVSNDGEANEEAQISKESLNSKDRKGEMYTKVLKRGKTSSIVVSSSCDYGLDGFSIFCRTMGSPPGSPNQLGAGISIWWQNMTSKKMSEATGKDLPLNLLMTFFGGLVSDVITNGTKQLGNILDKYQKLGNLAKPSLVDTYATTYEHVPDPQGWIRHTRDDREATREEKEQALKMLESDSELKNQFRSCNPRNDTLSEVIFSEDGGVDYVLEKLLQDAKNSQRHMLLNNKVIEFESIYANAVLARALPIDIDETAARARRIKSWVLAIEKKLAELQDANRHEYSSQTIGYQLRKFLHVEPDTLEMLPLSLEDTPTYDLERYVESQFCAWMDDRQFKDYEEIGLNADSFIAIRSDLIDIALDREENDYHDENELSIEEWISLNFDQVSDVSTAQNHRTFLALKISDALVGYTHREQERPDTENADAIFNALKNLSEIENERNQLLDYKQSPHYISFIEPFTNYLQKMCEERADARPEQAGDAQLNTIIGYTP